MIVHGVEDLVLHPRSRAFHEPRSSVMSYANCDAWKNSCAAVARSDGRGGQREPAKSSSITQNAEKFQKR